ncbi:hypothetical protein AB4Y87_25230 [Paenarthrobacter sp. RAF54_2]
MNISATAFKGWLAFRRRIKTYDDGAGVRFKATLRALDYSAMAYR